MSPVIDDRQREKAIRLVNYLQRLASLRAKVVRDISKYDRTLWISAVPRQNGCFARAWGRDEEHEPDEWLEVENRREPKLPDVPAQCKGWVNPPSLRDKNELPELLAEITRQIENPDWREGSEQPETIPQTEHLADHPEVKREWNKYVEDKWLPWLDEHNEWEEVHKVYSELFAIYQEQLRLGEEYELVIGMGLLTWQTPTGQRVRRHLVVADAFLQFEARLGKFTVRPHTEGSKLRPELDMLDIEEQPARTEETAKVSLAAAEDDPWEMGCVEGVLQALVHSINPPGDYDDSLEASNIRASAKPIVEYAPALILRKRSAKGLTETLKRIKELIEQGEDIPGEFADLAEIQPADDREPSDKPEEANVAFDGEIFFPKPSNEEQRLIVDKIRSASGVLVQGPPGTGKSHTIANLICHLLATGQRTLITAKTPRALQVLEGLVPEELRPLCINLLGSGLEERRSLESSVGGILRKSVVWNEDRAKRELTDLEERLRKLREEEARVKRQLRDIRESETHTQSIAGGAYQGTAARIAEAVNQDRSAYDWFTDSVSFDKTYPEIVDALSNILKNIRRFTSEKRRELNLVLPEVLPHSQYFSELVKKEASAIAEEQNSKRGADEQFADRLARNHTSAIEAIRNAFSTFRDTRGRLNATSHSWMNDALRDILGGNSLLWRKLLHVTRDAIASIEEHVAVADESRIEFPDSMDIRSLYEDTYSLKEHMENGGKLGWGVFRPKPVKERLHVIKAVRINGRPCSTVEHFSNLANALYVRIECEKAWGCWKGRSETVEGPYTLQLAALKSLRDALGNALALEELIANCRETMNRCPGMGEPTWADESQVERVVSSCRLALARILKRLAVEKIQSVEAPVSLMSVKSNAHPVTNDLLSAIRSRDVDRFARCANTIQELKNQRQFLQKLDEQLPKLRRSFPQFTKSLEQTCNEPHWEERVRRISAALHWAQARCWIENYILKEDASALAKRAKQIEDDICGIITNLAELRAWSFCFSRLGREHQQNMVAWQQAIDQLGRGHGINAAFWRREAQKHLNKCREAVPAWVMPLHRIWDTVEFSPEIFDIIIIDEASQCGFEGLPLFYLAKKIIIVGDDKQIRPDAVGVKRSAVQRLQEDFLFDFEFKSSFDVERSIFDHARRLYQQSHIVLREHFRCMPEIIRFSNNLCYSNTPLIPLRQYGPKRLPPLDHVFVGEGYREGSNNQTINRPEAEAIVKRIKELCGDKDYDGKTMGVVVLQGEAQAALIENQLLERLGAKEMEGRRLVCGNPYSFQGDQRDIMFLSLVAASNKRIGPLIRTAYERRFNVAASRARDMMILFHSVTCDDLSASCLRRKLLDFFENTEPQLIAGINRVELERRALQDKRSIVEPPNPFDSWFEVDVALELARKDFDVKPQYEVAGKRIDLVVEGGKARLAVECDGDFWHGPDKYEEDMKRQRILERCGWEFFRVRQSAFYANRETALKGLWQALEERGIMHVGLFVPFDKEESNDEEKEVDDDESLPDGSSENDYPAPLELANPKGRSSRRPEDVSLSEISNAILHALEKCPNQTCTLGSITSRVLKELSIITRGNPRLEFERRVKHRLEFLEGCKLIQKYKAKNERIRLLRPFQMNLPLDTNN